MTKIWEVMNVLFEEADMAFCNGILVGFATMTPRTTATLVLSKVARKPKFRKLYESIYDSPAAAYLIQHMSEADNSEGLTPPHSASADSQPNLRLWDYQSSTIKHNPLMRIFSRDLLLYVSPTSI